MALEQKIEIVTKRSDEEHFDSRISRDSATIESRSGRIAADRTGTRREPPREGALTDDGRISTKHRH
jgi:hypothetical protein